MVATSPGHQHFLLMFLEGQVVNMYVCIDPHDICHTDCFEQDQDTLLQTDTQTRIEQTL